MDAERIAKALGGRRAGADWMAKCPVHHDREPSLSVKAAKGGKVLVCCHAGCDQHVVIATLRARGLWSTASSTDAKLLARHAAATHEPDDRKQKRTEAALRIWRASLPGEMTPVATYLHSRGIVIAVP